MNEWPELHGLREGVPPPPPPPEIVRAALLSSALDGGLGDVAAHSASSPRRAWALLVMEARLLHPALWTASFAVMALIVVFVMIGGDIAETLLALAAPLIAGIGVAGLYGPEHDPAFELVAATPTSPRVILLARVTLVFGYDLALTLLASAALTVTGATSAGLTTLVVAWLGPMALLSALSLLFSVWWNPEAAIGVTLAVWSLPLLAHLDLRIADGPTRWENGPLTFGLAVVLTVAALILAGGGEPVRRTRATHPS
ncbi:hypothetical protein [Streptosporangium sp. KLBMP 9127]|nr:hypothetical protein [Streptosporangium sp. KLBMP 9127]